MDKADLRPAPYRFPGDPGYAVCVEYSAGHPGFMFHYHPEHELVLLRGGAGKRLIGDCLEDYAELDLVLVGPHIPHSWSYEQTPGSPARDYVVLAFTRESLGLPLLEKPECAAVRDLLDRARRGLSFPPAVARRVEERVLSIARADPLKRFLLLLDVLNDLAADPSGRPIVSEKYDPTGLERQHGTFARALSYVYENSDRPIPLADIAGHLKMSVPTFTRFFRRMTGMTFVTYLNRWRIRRACILLRETRDSVLDISTRVGYSNLSHFNRQFRRFQGMTPREYRKQG